MNVRLRSTRHFLNVLGLMVSLAPGAVESVAAQQRPGRLVDPAGCKDCSVTIRRTATLGGPESPLARFPHVVVQDGAGNLIVQGGNIDRRPPLVFDRSGRYIGSLGGVG